MSKESCGDPMECYAKSVNSMIELLKTDREDIREFHTTVSDSLDQRVAGIMAKKTEAYSKKFNAELEAHKKDYESKMEARMLAKIKSEVDAFKNEYHRNTGKTTNVHKHSNMYKEAIIYHDIQTKLKEGVVNKFGSPVDWNEHSYEMTLWNKRLILKIGRTELEKHVGMQTKIPEGYNVLWLRCLNDRWETFNVLFLDGAKEDLGNYNCGHRTLNEISPDGGAADSQRGFHAWLPIPVRRSGSVLVKSGKHSDSWISGVAFGKNLWNHARNSGVNYHWALNGGTPLGWHSNWYNDNLAMIEPNKISTMMVPVTPSGKDKLIYIVEHNNNWVGIMHKSVKVNGKLIERFRTGYNNPFAVHFNSKMYQRYIAARVPKELIKDSDTFMRVEVDMTKQDQKIHFREAGSHDFE